MMLGLGLGIVFGLGIRLDLRKFNEMIENECFNTHYKRASLGGSYI